MNTELREFLTEETEKLLGAPSAGAKAKAAAEDWLKASGTAGEDEAAKTYVDTLTQCIATIDETIGFAKSEDAVKYMGADGAKQLLAHAESIKAGGAKFCDCPACAACEAILKKFGKI